MEIHDLAISKLIAGREKDFAYVKVLLRHKLVQYDLFLARLADTPIKAQRRTALRTRLRSLVQDRQPF